MRFCYMKTKFYLSLFIDTLVYVSAICYLGKTLFKRLYNKINIIEITIPLIILKGITPDTIIIFKLPKTSDKFIIMP